MVQSDKPVLVTGASGFVGASVVRALLAAGRKVRALLRPSSDRRNVEDLAVDVRLGSLTEPRSLAAALEGCGALYHVAADYRLWVRNPAEMYAANVDGTRSLMEAALAAGVGRIVYTSSVATLGWRADGGAADETTPSTLADMVGHYKRSKFLAEAAVRDLVRTRALPAVIVNPSTPVGPRDVKPTPTGRIIVEAVRGRIPGFVDTGLNLVHVDDVADGHLAALRRGAVGQRYILGGQDVLLADMLAAIARLAGRRPPRWRIPRQAIVPFAYASELAARITGREPMLTLDGLRMSEHHMFFSSAKAERELGYRARPYREALADAVRWFRDTGYCG